MHRSVSPARRWTARSRNADSDGESKGRRPGFEAGVLAPRSAWRKDIVPKPRERRPACDAAAFVDVLECPRCRGRLHVVAVITEREPVRRILTHLGLPSELPPLARARDPTRDLDDEEPSGQLGLGLA